MSGGGASQSLCFDEAATADCCVTGALRMVRLAPAGPLRPGQEQRLRKKNAGLDHVLFLLVFLLCVCASPFMSISSFLSFRFFSLGIPAWVLEKGRAHTLASQGTDRYGMVVCINWY
jgi:cytochrome b561